MGVQNPISMGAALYKREKNNRLIHEWLFSLVHIIFRAVMISCMVRLNVSFNVFVMFRSSFISDFCLSPAWVPVKALDDRWGWWERSNLVPPNQSGHRDQLDHNVIPRLCRRSGCGHLFPNKSHTAIASSCLGFPSLSLSHSLSCFYNHSDIHTSCDPSLSFIHSLYICVLFWFVLMSLSILSLLLSSLSVSVTNVADLLLFQPLASVTYAIFLSVRLWMGLRFLRNVCGNRKVFSVQKNDNLSFFLVLSLPRWICSQQLSLRVSRKTFFYSVSRSQWGHAAGTTPWPALLTFSLPIRFPLVLGSSPNLTDVSHSFFGAEGENYSVHVCHFCQIPQLSKSFLAKTTEQL